MPPATPTLQPLRGHTLPSDDGRPMRPVKRTPHGRPLPKARPKNFQSVGLTVAVLVSVALHLILLAIRFVIPQPPVSKPPDSALEVILVNARSADKPVKPQAIAQFDLNGGGDQEEGRATSFLPRKPEIVDGEVLKESQAAVQQLEAEQRHLVTQTRDATAVAMPTPPKTDATATASTADPDTSLKAIARLEAQIDKQTRDYNARPRRGYIGPTTRGASYALYYAQWKDRVERIGTLHYPEEARGKIYGDLTLRVTLNPDGTIFNNEVEIVQTSGSPILDRAARHIVLLGAPYNRFSDELRRDYDVFEIFSTFRFTKGDAIDMTAERR